MAIVVAILIVAAATWLVVAAPHLRVWGLSLAAIVVAYPLGHAFWHVRIGPLPLTIDRLLLVALVGLLAYRARAGLLQRQPWTMVDYLLVGWVAWLSASAFVSLPSEPNVLPESSLGRLAFSFWIPLLLYFAGRQIELSDRVLRVVFGALAALGTYLAVTAVAEVTGQWWAVFPRYISDPELGLHFGRARGPLLNSVSLGVYLSVCLWAAWSLIRHVPRCAQLALGLAMALMAVGVVLTVTRSVWLGLAASAVWMMFAYLPRQIRWPATLGTIATCVVLLVAARSSLVSIERENTVGDAAHSVQQRAAFLYVSWHMFQDHPLWGVGFGRFYDQKLPYLQDRRQSFELESIRGLHHHNTFLSMLTETGMIGLAGLIAVLASWGFTAWRVAFGDRRSATERQFGRLLLATIIIYCASALFHDLTLLPQDQWLLFFVAGVASAAAYAPHPVAATNLATCRSFIWPGRLAHAAT